MEKIETSISFISSLENGLIRVEMKDRVEITLDHLEENLEVYRQLIQKGERKLFLLIFDSLTGCNAIIKARLAAKSRTSLKLAEAVVIKNVGQRFEVSFYKKHYDISYPMKVFDNEEEATEWLLNQKLYETSISYIQKVEEDIIRIEVKADTIVNKEGLNQNLKTYESLLPNGGYFISIIKETNTASNDVKQPFESNDRVRLKKAEAFVVESLANRIELEYYINKTKQMYPTKVFEFESEAMEWLETIRASAN